MRMLGRYQRWVYRFDGEKWQWVRTDSERKTRYRKLAEKRRWQQELLKEEQ